MTRRIIISCQLPMCCLAISTVFFSAPPAGAGINDFIGFWNFNDQTANDISNNQNHGTIAAAADPPISFSSDTPLGSSGFSLNLQGSGDVRIPHSDSLAFANGEMTLAMWMKATSDQPNSPWGGTIAKRSEPRNGGGWETQQFDLQERIDIRIDTSEQENAVRGNLVPAYDDTGNWHHVAWTVDNGEVDAFLDGVKINADPLTYNHGDGFSNMSDLVIGSRDGFGTVNGLLDGIGLWNEVLSDEDIAALAISESPCTPGVDCPIPGDVNGDRIINLDDFGIIRTNYGQSPAKREDGNLNGDDAVNAPDFREWKDNHMPAGGSSLASVPEPSGLALVMTVAGWLAVCSGRRHVSSRSS